MSEAYVGEIRMFGGTFAPEGWLLCDGSTPSIGSYPALGALLGTTYGGDGQNTFGLPDLRGRVPVHQGNGVNLGQESGSETVTLNTPQLPVHTHAYQGADASASLPGPGNDVVANGVTAFMNAAATVAMSGSAVGSYGGGGSHDNVQPFLCLTFIICTEGIYPTQA